MLISDCFKNLYERYGASVLANTQNTFKTPPHHPTNKSEAIDKTESIPPIAPSTPKTPAWDEYWQECYEERAAILEYDGKLSRSEAEKQALKMIEEERHGQSITYH